MAEAGSMTRPRQRQYAGSAKTIAAALVAAGCCQALLSITRPSVVFTGPRNEVASSSGVQFLPNHAQQPSTNVALRAYSTVPVGDPPPDPYAYKQRRFTPTAEHLSYAIVYYAKRQHMVVEGGMYESAFFRAVPGAKIRFNHVYLLKEKNANGEFDINIGQPIIDGAYVEATILEHFKSEDQVFFKHVKKKHQMKRWISNTKVTRFRIDKIVRGNPTDPVEGFPPRRLRDAEKQQRLYKNHQRLLGMPDGKGDQM
eukprot:TRINITY_DN63688_c0_g1_i1.p1 TRINITY_DN63688_c0_g1~~TRINITY_DN63688_c0_g1_i1.p1  ORF type:complete len:255 (+),score=43.52 TRINITY_DN63688_c0_g1_i1:58-822(+)